MLIKTPEFHERFLRDLANIIVYSKNYREKLNDLIDDKQLDHIEYNTFGSVKIIGSYLSKEYGSSITDVDLEQIVTFNENFLLGFKQKFSNLNRTNFTFIRFYCGEDEELAIPWSIDEHGSCKYDPDRTLEWFTKLKPLVPQPTYEKAADLLLRPTISLKDLLAVEQLVRPSISFSWKLDDIKRGELNVRGRQYKLLETMQTYWDKKMVKLLYKYNNEYCMVDCNFKQFGEKTPRLFNRYYYENNLFSMAKTFKIFLPPDAMTQFRRFFRSQLGELSAISARVELINKATQYNVLPKSEIERLKIEIRKYESKYNIDVSNTNAVKEFVYEKVKGYYDKFRNLVGSQKRLRQLDIYEIRAKEAAEQIPKDIIYERLRNGVDCPFFLIDIADLENIYSISVRIGIDAKKVVHCLYQICEELKRDPHTQAKTLFGRNDYYLKHMDNEYLLISKGSIIDRSKDPARLKIRILFDTIDLSPRSEQSGEE
jgi:hypothetical protein